MAFSIPGERRPGRRETTTRVRVFCSGVVKKNNSSGFKQPTTGSSQNRAPSNRQAFGNINFAEICNIPTKASEKYSCL